MKFVNNKIMCQRDSEGMAGKDARDNIKPDYSLLPKSFLDQVSLAMMAGEIKYGRYNYLKGHKSSELTAAIGRHLKQYEAGEEFDKDCSERVGKQVSHLACVASGILMLLDQTHHGVLSDDRYKTTAKKEAK